MDVEIERGKMGRQFLIRKLRESRKKGAMTKIKSIDEVME